MTYARPPEDKYDPKAADAARAVRAAVIDQARIDGKRTGYEVALHDITDVIREGGTLADAESRVRARLKHLNPNDQEKTDGT